MSLLRKSAYISHYNFVKYLFITCQLTTYINEVLNIGYVTQCKCNLYNLYINIYLYSNAGMVGDGTRSGGHLVSVL